MKIFSLFITLVFLTFGQINAQIQKAHDGNLSASTLQFISSEINPNKLNKDKGFVYSTLNNKTFVSAFIKVNEQIQEATLHQIGIKVGTKAGNIWTIKIPVEQVGSLTSVHQGIEYIQLDRAIHANLEKALTKTRVDSVHNGIFLPQAYTGQDVVVGILDVGFDYTHPVFYDIDGNKFRIKRVWEQKSEGTPPNGYSYGHELADSMSIIAGETDNMNESHGTHVAGIAGGSGYGGNGAAHQGVAYNSDLVFVGITPPQEQWKNSGMADIIDGVNYVFNYAESVGKPAVANLSWGCSIGPHDGTSLFGQALDNLTGPGKIFTISAGNNGTNRIHLQQEFSNTDTLLRSFVNFSSSFPEDRTWLDIWGEAGEEFCFQFQLYSGNTEGDKLEFMCLNNSTVDTFLIGSDNDTVFFNWNTFESDINGKPHAFIDIYSKTENDLSLGVKGSSGTVDLWLGYVYETRGHYGDFATKGKPWAKIGNTDMTIGEMGCAKSAITVAAYASKTTFTNLIGQNLSYTNYVQANKLCPFSSRGPTTGNYMKPDITAPGLTLASAVNSFDLSYASGGGNYANSVYKYTDPNSSKDYYFAEASGTSMSSPMTAGIVALVLEEDPTASPEDIKAILAATAIKDSYTTIDPDPNKWGFGKINAYGMLQYYFASAQEEIILEAHKMFPNPTNGNLNIEIEGLKKVLVLNAFGAVCHTEFTTNQEISMQNLSDGIYYVIVFSPDNKIIARQKIIKQH